MPLSFRLSLDRTWDCSGCAAICICFGRHPIPSCYSALPRRSNLTYPQNVYKSASGLRGSPSLRTTFGQPSDNLRTLLGLFKTVSGWARIELLDASPTCKKLASHMLAYELIYLMLKFTVFCSNPIGHFISYDLGQKCCRVGRSRKL